MFERFTSEARDIVARAQVEARALGHSWIGTEHLLLALLGQPEAPGASALRRLGVTREACLSLTRDSLGSGEALGADEAAALHTIGIDLDEVRRRVEESFGVGALDSPPRLRRRGLLGTLRRRTRRGCGPGPWLTFTPKAKRALERSLRESLTLGDRHIGVEHVVLGLLDPKGNLAVEILRRLGADPGGGPDGCARRARSRRLNHAFVRGDQRYAGSPVSTSPTTSVWISLVPS